MDVPLCVGVPLPLAEHVHRPLRGHIQVEHQVRFRQAQPAIFKVKQPLEERRPLLRGDLAGLMNRVGGGVPVRQHQPPCLVVPLPYLLPGGIPVHRVEAGGRVGVHIAGLSPKLSVEIHPQQGGGLLLILGKHQPLKGNALVLCPAAQPGKLSGLARAIGALNDNQAPPLHGFPRFPFSRAASSRNRGSLAIRPSRLG